MGAVKFLEERKRMFKEGSLMHALMMISATIPRKQLRSSRNGLLHTHVRHGRVFSWSNILMRNALMTIYTFALR